jgi:sugar (pentulose or hexulose) kinase
VWSKDHDVFQTGGVPQDKLLDVYPPGTVYGQVTKAAAAATGLPEGLPVVAGAGDKQCEVLGGGGIAPGQAYVAYGTLSCLCTTVYEQAVIAESGGYWTWGAAVPGAWHLEAGIVGHWMVTWFRDEFCRDAVEEAGKRGVSPEQILNEEAAEIPPGAQGLVVFPYWRPPSYLPQATGLMLGFHDAVHKRPHVFRAILEGIAFELRRGLEVFARDSGVPITDVVVGGGGSKSDLGMQATADIFGVPCKRPHTSETCALGAAISGAAGAGMYSSFAEAAQHMTRSASVFEPIPENVDLYDAMYEKVFTMVCPALAEVFKSITEIRECTLQEQT